MRFRIPFLIGLVIGGFLSGCGPSEPPVALPPPPSERGEFSDPTGTASDNRAASITLILPAASTLESILLAEIATREAGIQKALIETRRPRPDEPTQTQADLIRQAAHDGASVLIVLANNDASLAGAIDAVQRDGTPVIVVGDSLDCETMPYRIDTVDYRKVVAEMVAIAVNDARQSGRDVAEKPILLVREMNPDSHTEARIAALEAALTEASLDPIRVKFAENQADAANALEAALKEHPKTTLVFGDSDEAVLGASGVWDQHSRNLGSDDPAPFVYAGFLCDPIQVNALKLSGSMAAFVDWNVPGIARAAVRDALKLSRKEKLPAASDIPTPLIQPRNSSSRTRGARPQERLDG